MKHFFAVLAVAVVSYVGYLLIITGELRTIEPHFDGQCTLVRGVVGAEDIAILQDGSGAYISSMDRRGQLEGRAAEGNLFFYDLRATDAVPVSLKPNLSLPFHPHGLGLLESQPGAKLFVVNHPGADVHGDLPSEEPDAPPAHSIEVFAVDGSSATHLQRYVDSELLISPNDVAPVSDSVFYVTNDHGSGNKLVRLLENYFRVPRSHMLLFQNGEFERLEGRYGYANGVIASRDGAEIYMASPTDRKVFVFSRDSKTNELLLQEEVFVDTAPDNISVDEGGSLWIGAHPHMLTLSMYLNLQVEQSPSQVVKVAKDGRGYKVEEVFLSDGSDLSGSTVAARFGNRLLVGAVFDDGFLDCVLSAEE